jgi:hypothetical protein
MEAPKGRGLGVLREQAVKAARAFIRPRSADADDEEFADGPRRGFCFLSLAERLTDEAGTPILEISMVCGNIASRNL